MLKKKLLIMYIHGFKSNGMAFKANTLKQAFGDD